LLVYWARYAWWNAKKSAETTRKEEALSFDIPEDLEIHWEFKQRADNQQQSQQVNVKRYEIMNNSNTKMMIE